MTDTPSNDKPGFVAERPEHCHARFRLIHPGQTDYLTIEQEVLCADCALVEEIIRVREDLAVEVKRDGLLVWRKGMERNRQPALSTRTTLTGSLTLFCAKGE